MSTRPAWWDGTQDEPGLSAHVDLLALLGIGLLAVAALSALGARLGLLGFDRGPGGTQLPLKVGHAGLQPVALGAGLIRPVVALAQLGEAGTFFGLTVE